MYPNNILFVSFTSHDIEKAKYEMNCVSSLSCSHESICLIFLTKILKQGYFEIIFLSKSKLGGHHTCVT